MNDLISRQAAIEALDDNITLTGWGNSVAVRDYILRAKKRLQAISAAQPERMGKWIPCRLVLPAPEQRVICCTKTKKGTANIIVGYHDGDRWCCGMNNNVVAWMELPEPYEEGNR